MPGEVLRNVQVWQQTKALLYKNILIKWRTKRHSLQELFIPLFFVVILIPFTLMVPDVHNNETSTHILHAIDEMPLLDFRLGYTPANHTTKQIIDNVVSSCFRHDIMPQAFPDEQELENARRSDPDNFVGIVFSDHFSYKLRFSFETVPLPNKFVKLVQCDRASCEVTTYHTSGFCMLQACLDAAIIEMETKHSVWEELSSVVPIVMGMTGARKMEGSFNRIILLYLAISLAPLPYFLLVNVVAEKEEKLEESLKMMGLCSSAFWFSWGFLYLGLVFVMSILMSVIATFSPLFPHSSCFVIFLLIFLYGVSLISFSFMLSPLFKKLPASPSATAKFFEIPVFKKSKAAGTFGYFFILIFAFFSSFLVLAEDVPKPLVWSLSPFCAGAFFLGVIQVLFLEQNNEGAHFSNLLSNPYPLLVPLIMLVVDSVLYLLIALYLDQVLPGEYGMRRSPLYFLKPSYWFRRKTHYVEVNEFEQNSGPDVSAVVEPVPSEFQGRAAIRIHGLGKVYKENDKNVHVLRGLTFDIYEGHITALLGHSGNGKTTLLNILCGICPPSDGFATIYGYNVSEIDEMLEMRKIVGVCPQFDIKYDVLTVEENLKTFAAIKGIPARAVNQEVQKVLKALSMEDIQDNQASSLSGGQKRKLSFAIAVLGDPKVLLLDEPTAGMDPSSRHLIWTFLKNRKATGVTVFTTHFMDEADILADRKAVISKGVLKCIGSSMFLKRKWGVGYLLSMFVNESCDADSVTLLVKQHMPNAELSQRHEQELTYTLPFEDMDCFSGLFSELDHCSDLGIHTFGVSMTTLEDVYLKLEEEEETDRADYSVFNPEEESNGRDAFSLDEMEQNLLAFSENEQTAVTGTVLWRQQVCAIAKLHFLNFRRNGVRIAYILLLLIIFVIILLLMAVVSGTIGGGMSGIELTKDLYLLHPGKVPRGHRTSLLLMNLTDSPIDDLIHLLTNQDISVELVNRTVGFQEVAPHNAALLVSHSGENYSFVAGINATMIHSLPMMMNIISNALLASLNVTKTIRIWNTPFYWDSYQTVAFSIQAGTLGTIAAVLPPYFAMDNVQDQRMKARSQLRTSGLYSSAYWCGQAMVDVPVYWVCLISMIIALLSFHIKLLSYPGAVISLILCLAAYAPAVVLLTYVASIKFVNMHLYRGFCSFLLLMSLLISDGITGVTILTGNAFITNVLHFVFSVFVPVYPLLGCLYSVSDSPVEPGDETRRSIFITVITPYLHCIILLFLLQYLEAKSAGRVIRKDPFFRIYSKKLKVQKNTEEPECEDEDVQAERAKVKEALTCHCCQERPAIVVSNLRKEFEATEKGSTQQKRKKVAVKTLSLCVRKGEVLGLLGPNGAGKSTALYMLAGETEPTAGQIQLGCSDGESSESIGYCPQVNSLWPKLTLQDHLEAYTAIRGISKKDASVIIKWVANALGLNEHLQKQVNSLPTGVQRQLCFVISMVGNPQIVLLDEPSTGMDPKGKRRIWKAIHAAFKNKARGAILTTHYMEEAEAVCDRVAIMVSGQLRCIGSIQHLKSKYGKSYHLEVKPSENVELQLEDLNREILGIFPHATQQESFTSVLVYKVPMEDVQSLSQAFCKLQQAKYAFKIEEYSFSQTTLEQVFIEIAKEQEKDHEEYMNVNKSFKWSQLQQEEC
ncbi:ATP-binding cassette sub-family A member 5 [Latimeria chalumnae]|uniref:ATP-binding cassette sub-family A member 5 n=1 Tax=Latimeria chalumnae TaxID=7897 RepID=UPI00313C90E4